jgi:hypothetical protein
MIVTSPALHGGGNVACPDIRIIANIEGHGSMLNTSDLHSSRITVRRNIKFITLQTIC